MGTLADTKIMRWGASASEVIFVNRPLASFWSWGKVVPIVRGWGVHQPAMNFLQSRLDAGVGQRFPRGQGQLAQRELKAQVGGWQAHSRLPGRQVVRASRLSPRHGLRASQP